MSTGFWTPSDDVSVWDQMSTGSHHEQSSLSPFASMEWQDLHTVFENLNGRGSTVDGTAWMASTGESSRSPQLQLVLNGSRFELAQGGDGAPQSQRTYTVGPTQLMPNEIFDLQASLDAQSQVNRSLRWLRENTQEGAMGISPDIIDADTIRGIAQGIHGARESLAANLPPGRNPPLLQMGLGQSVFEHAQRMFPNNPERRRTEIGVQVALLGRALNQELERLGSPLRLGPLQVGVDQQGHTFLGLPVRHDGVQTNIIRFPPLASPQEIQQQRANAPRIV